MKLTQLNDLAVEAVSHNPAIQKRVMLRWGDIPHLTNFSQACFAPGQVAPAHAHTDMCEVFFVESGYGTIRIDGQVYPMEPGSCIAIEPLEEHEITNNGSTDLILTYFGLRVEPPLGDRT
ncbi:cupin domain-containing protein [Kamptonema cortianum]|nr:cupin domain-containing protein [Kamptonema cortianum]